jgi:cytochrome c oxidase cbb3-type subunit III
MRHTSRLRRSSTLLLAGLLLASSSCTGREGFNPDVPPAAATALDVLVVTDLYAGPVDFPARGQHVFGGTAGPIHNPYEESPMAVAEGQRLYQFFNCNGCHANGGGGIGPPLMDDTWIYGSRPEQVFASIVQGRPEGMPAYRGRIPDYQVWQITAFVRSLAGLTDPSVRPRRADSMSSSAPRARSERPEPERNPSDNGADE